LQGLRVALLHGRMVGAEKEEVMGRFAAGEVDVLVATTVIEVGIDVPNASVMVVEHAERFGLSQLHQLRGRVGRGEHASVCLLIAATSGTDVAWERLQAMVHSQDGFELAEVDLRLRGPGELAGTRQTGLPTLSVADLRRDTDILMAARQEAQRLLADDPLLDAGEHAALAAAVEGRWSGRIGLAQIG